MKPLKDVLAATIDKAEKTRRRKGRGPATATPQEHGYAVTKLSAERARRRKDEARQIVRQVRQLDLDPETLAKVAAAAKVHAQSSENWIFVMLSPAQNAEVIDWLLSNSKRPLKAVMLWARLLEKLDMHTGEIRATRQELADRVNMNPSDLSKTMTELASINAVRREKEGRAVRYFLNPGIATHMPSAAQRKAARDKVGPLLKLIESPES